MNDWNVIMTARDGCWSRARRAARSLGRADRSGFYNVLVLKADQPRELLGRLDALVGEDAAVAAAVAHVSPVEQCFDFATAADFHLKAREAMRALSPQLAGKTFHVRMHRRGWKHALSSADQERGLADVLIEATRERGAEARVSFDDPDVIVVLETVGGRAGIGVWSRTDRQEHPLLATR